MDFRSLCGNIDLPEEMRKEAICYYQSGGFDTVRPFVEGLRNMETESNARDKLNRLLDPDPKKAKMLAFMLSCASDLYLWYQEKGISETIFLATMRCFTRFIEECREITGQYAFDREWWTARQISGNLFRIGELEYEMTHVGQKPVISIHIPSDSVLTPQNCSASLESAKAFFAKFFPLYEGKDFVCHSWLLAPELKSLLPPDSNIILFQHRFLLQDVDYSEIECMDWVFKTRNVPIAELPENTTLQKNMKRHLLNGGKIGCGRGRLI